MTRFPCGGRFERVVGRCSVFSFLSLPLPLPPPPRRRRLSLSPPYEIFFSLPNFLLSVSLFSMSAVSVSCLLPLPPPLSSRLAGCTSPKMFLPSSYFSLLYLCLPFTLCRVFRFVVFVQDIGDLDKDTGRKLVKDAGECAEK